ncbi:DUF2975 domain-containing protein [Evansella sp. AB-rgal1]|uniref:DUF2975 domain-containing protein n=1 Tax=Evansella sp. AB-rgal1 TaxID=3242696 RepID=UPI00359EB5C0
MANSNIQVLRRIADTVYKIVSFFFWGSIIFFVLFIGNTIWASFLPQDSFTAESGIRHWLIQLDNDSYWHISVLVPFTNISPIDLSRFSVKSAFLTYSITSNLTLFPALLYGIYLVKRILENTIDGHSPFTHGNVNNMKQLAYVLIAYSLFSELIINIFVWIFVTQIFKLSLANIHLFGAGIGAVILIISYIFQHGVYLQEEHDTTL